MWTTKRNKQELGVTDSGLTPCPQSPNCVSTQGSGSQFVPSLTLTTDSMSAMRIVRATLVSLPRTKIVTCEGDYVHAEFTSRIMRFVDDFEIWIDVSTNLIHARSASRLGYSDLGANRRRVEKVQAMFVKRGIAKR